MTKEEAKLLAVMKQCLDDVKEDIKEIKRNVKEQNGNIKDTMLKLAKTEDIAVDANEKSDMACEKSDSNRKIFYGAFSGLAIVVIVTLGTIIAQLL